jgi:hypothetical protein
MPSVATARGNSAHPLGTTGFQGYVRIADQRPSGEPIPGFVSTMGILRKLTEASKPWPRTTVFVSYGYFL